jgi:hypothetical protein
MDRLRLLTAAAIVFATAACGSSLPLARTSAVKDQDRVYVDVPYPPPAAQVEVIPPAPDRAAVWVDGEWSWKGRRWAWEPGGWVLPPHKDAFFAPWAIAIRPEDGTMRFSPGSWHAADGTPLPKPRVLLSAETGAASVGRP